MTATAFGETSSITVNPEIEKIIAEWSGPNSETILRSVDGRALGRFVPSPTEGEMPWEPELTEREFIDRARLSKRHKLKDAMARFGAK